MGHTLDIQLLFLHELECKIRNTDTDHHPGILRCGLTDGADKEPEKEEAVYGNSPSYQLRHPVLFQIF